MTVPGEWPSLPTSRRLHPSPGPPRCRSATRHEPSLLTSATRPCPVSTSSGEPTGLPPRPWTIRRVSRYVPCETSCSRNSDSPSAWMPCFATSEGPHTWSTHSCPCRVSSRSVPLTITSPHGTNPVTRTPHTPGCVPREGGCRWHPPRAAGVVHLGLVSPPSAKPSRPFSDAHGWSSQERVGPVVSRRSPLGLEDGAHR